MRDLHRQVERRRGGTRWGMTLIEVTLSTLVVATMMLAALHAVTTTRLGMLRIGDQNRGMLLAQDLMSEVLSQHYADPNEGTGTFGLETGESVAADRSGLNDVDDYHGWISSPPTYRNGSAIAGLTGWTRGVTVVFLDPDDLSVASRPKEVKFDPLDGDLEVGGKAAKALEAAKGGFSLDNVDLSADDSVDDTGLKRITVFVLHEGRTVAQLTAVRAEHGPPPPEDVYIPYSEP